MNGWFKDESRNKLANLGLGFLHGLNLDFILCGDVVMSGYTSRYIDYHRLILEAKSYPFDLLVRGNGGNIINSLKHWIKKNNLPFTISKKLEKITVNKKADA